MWLKAWLETDTAKSLWMLEGRQRRRLFGSFLWRPRFALAFRDAIEEGRSVRAAFDKAERVTSA